MRALLGFSLIVATCLPAFAQQPQPAMTPFGQQAGTPASRGELPGQQPVCLDCPTKVFAIRYVDIREIVSLLKPFDVPSSYDLGLRAISVKAPEKTLNAIEEVIKRFDVPVNVPKQVEVTAYLVLGSPQAEPDATPAALKPVIDQLRNVMAYKSYRVLDTIMLTGKEGDAVSENGITPKLSDTDNPAQYQFGSTLRIVTGEGTERVIHFENLHLDLTSGGAIRTSVDIKKGQQIVIGKTTLKDRAVILILSAKIVD